MIRMIKSISSDHAKSYFSNALSKSDYYISDQELAGQWQGKLADRLGLSGVTTKEAFFALCENRHPDTYQPLTPRTKTARRVGYDINFHCPKSVSILHALSGDMHILEAFKASVTETMHAIEADAKTRVRKDKANGDRLTEELVWGHFVHQTARPVEGFLPDPHLHSHCFVFNATWDAVEGRFKAGEFGDIKRDMPYYQAQFHLRLADKLMALGYDIRKTAKAFEIEGVPQRVIDLFSKRTDEIGRIAEERGITDPAELAELGARTRGGKNKGLSMQELREGWQAQIDKLGITPDEAASTIRHAQPIRKQHIKAQDCVDYALAHCFERASVVEARRLLKEAYRFALNKDVLAADIDAAFAADKRIIHVTERGRSLCTTKEVLAEEKHMVALAKNGFGKMVPLYAKAPAIALMGQQEAAIAHILTTTNRVSIIRGAAGAGKTTLMREAVPLIEAAGKKVITVAPSANASRGVLREEGFKAADTVALLLLDQQMQASLKNQVLWVDEAGLLGTKDMTAILELAEKQNAQVILGGDTRQHASVVRGDALRILNTVAGIRAAEVDKIYRQHDLTYRAAVQDLAKGNIEAAFEKLDGAGHIHEMAPQEAADRLAETYLAKTKEGFNTLVISPTHAQGDIVTDKIRAGLHQQGKLGKKEIFIDRLKNLGMTEAQRTDAQQYQTGQIVQFTQNATGFKRGSRWIVEKSDMGSIDLIGPNGARKPLPQAYADRYNVYAADAVPLAKGDIVRITQNGFDKKDRRMNNNDVLTVTAVSKKGDVTLQNVKSKLIYNLDKNFGHITHAYCVTSHASQGKNVDVILLYQPAATFPATDAKQFYVSVSRGRERLYVFTDDKEELLNHAKLSGERQSALELLRIHKMQKDFVMNATRLHQNPPSRSRGMDI